jgi:hypothetical protein
MASADLSDAGLKSQGRLRTGSRDIQRVEAEAETPAKHRVPTDGAWQAGAGAGYRLM